MKNLIESVMVGRSALRARAWAQVEQATIAGLFFIILYLTSTPVIRRPLAVPGVPGELDRCAYLNKDIFSYDQFF
jgi:hypothetical protein